MPSLVIGRVQPINQGNYDATRAYVVLDRVKYQGAWYECQADAAAGTAPEVGGNAYWIEIGGKGANGLTPMPVWNGTELHFAYSDGTVTSAVDLKGPQGIQGVQGEKGDTPPLTSDLTSTAADVALSALGGKMLKDLADGAVHAVMPSDKYIEYAWPAQSNVYMYPAPADGYYSAGAVTTRDGGAIVLASEKGTYFNQATAHAGVGIYASIPVQKGEKIKIAFSENAVDVNRGFLRFVYANGSAPAA